MQIASSAVFLRRVLFVDAVSSAGMGLAMLSFGPALAALLDLPPDLMRQAGLALIPFAAFVGYLASRDRPARIGVWAVIALNVVWTLDSVLLLLTGWVEPNAPGYVFVIAQAVAVGVFAELEYIGLRKQAVARA